MTNPKVFFDISIGDENVGRIEFELFRDIVPITAENFRCMWTGEKGNGDSSKSLSFKNAIFYSVLPKIMCQGGNITNNSEKCGYSIYGGKFDDENFNVKHNKKGILSMANSGPNTNNSEFFITFTEAECFDNKYVAFGQVTNGIDILDKIEKFGSESGVTSKVVKITNCGQLS